MKTELIGKSKIIISNPDGIHKYFAWPSAARLQNGKIAIVCSGFRIGHICPFGKAVIVYSEDEGETYTAPAPVIDTILDDRDAGIAVIGEKDVVVTSFNLDWQCLKTYREWYKGYEEYVDGYVSLISDEDVKKTSASRFRVSHNCGMTFSETYRSPVTSPHGPIELKDGSLLWVGRIYRDDNEHHSETDLAAYKIYLDGRCEFRGALGQTYEGDTPVFSCEPNAIELDDGTILCHLRAHYKCMLGIYQTESKDGGKTWSKPHRITEWQEGAPAHLIKHSSGLLISTYGHRNGIDSGIRVMFSKDNGQTWDIGHVIFETDTGEDLGYPATVELKDGSLLTVFYAHVAKDGPAVIMQQKWKIR